MQSIREIIDLISKDNTVAFNKFYDRYYEQVFHIVFYFLKEKESCKEIVSDVFFSVWQNRQRLKEVTEIESWLYVLTRNRALRYLGKIKNDIVSFDDDILKVAVHIHNEDDSPTPENMLLSKEMDLILTDAINALPPKCRTIFIMHRKNGLKTKEIAEILSLQESTVRVQMKIAVEKIVAAVKPHFSEYFA